MFDFRNLDDIDVNGAPPEWLKWSGEPEYQRVADFEAAVLEDNREESFTSPVKIQYGDKLDIPFLPSDAFDPLNLAADTLDAVEAEQASLNGQAILNFVVTAVEKQSSLASKNQSRKDYITSLHEQRLAEIGQTRAKDIGMASSPIKKVDFNRTTFSWVNQAQSLPLVGSISNLRGSAVMEGVFFGKNHTMKRLTPVLGGAMVSTAMQVQLICTMANNTLEAPANMRRNADWHLAMSDVFFPDAFIVGEGSQYAQRNSGPTLVHMVAMSVAKEVGALTAAKLLGTLKFARPWDFPSLKHRSRPVLDGSERIFLDPNMPD